MGVNTENMSEADMQKYAQEKISVCLDEGKMTALLIRSLFQQLGTNVIASYFALRSLLFENEVRMYEVVGKMDHGAELVQQLKDACSRADADGMAKKIADKPTQKTGEA